MSLSNSDTDKAAQAATYEMADFGQPRQLGSGGPAPMELPVFTDSAPKPEQPLLDRQGFSPLFLSGRDQDPREAAEQEAKEMVAAAGGEVETIRSQAKQSGYEAGYAQGQSEGREASAATMTATLDNLERILAALSDTRANILANMEEELAALVAAATDLVLMRKDAVDPGIIQDVMRHCLARLTDAKRLSVRISQADLEAAEDFVPELRQRLGELEHLEVVADPDLARGDCVVDSDTAEIDATLATRRDQLLSVLNDTLHSEEGIDFSPLAEAPPDKPDPPQPDDEFDLEEAGADDSFDLDDSPDDDQEEDW